MPDKATDPSTPSLAHEALADTWAMIQTIRGGAKAVRDAGVRYLPKHPKESEAEYDRRRRSAPWRPEFEDAVRSISSKPFAKPVQLMGEPSREMQAIAEDVDGRGNNLHTFSRDLFEDAVSLGAAGILVEFPAIEGTMADQRQAGARVYWCAVAADEIVALRTERQGAREVVTHLRLRETGVEYDGFEEKEVERIRQFEPGRWVLYRLVREGARKEWIVEREGALPVAEVPFVLFTTNDRQGAQYTRPPLLDLAEMQLELFRFMSGEEQIYTMAGAPMLTANGMAAPDDGSEVEVGPGRILFAPGAEGITTGWAYVQPDAANLTAITEKAGKIITDMRRLGMQPMLPGTGDVTATATGVEAAKAHSAVQSWALDLKDALEQAFRLTAARSRSTEQVEVSVNTDFAVGLYGAEEVRVLLDARKGGYISEETFWDELARRGVLGPAFDKDEERDRLEAEEPADDEIDLSAAMLPPQVPGMAAE